jgi:hypothetical protein
LTKICPCLQGSGPMRPGERFEGGVVEVNGVILLDRLLQAAAVALPLLKKYDPKV